MIKKRHWWKQGLTLSALLVVVPAFIAASCTGVAIRPFAPAPTSAHVYLVDQAVQNSPTRKQLQVDNISRNDLRNVAVRGLGFFDAEMVAGGYGEKRTFYDEAGTVAVHNGTDVLLNTNQKVYAPADAEVIASFWYNNTEAGADFALGVGGIVLMRVKIADLALSDFDKETLYVQYGPANKIAPVPRFIFRQLDKTYRYPTPRNLVVEDAAKNLVLGQTTPEGALVVSSKERSEYNAMFHQMVTKADYEAYLTSYYASLSGAALTKALALAARDEGYVLLQYMHAGNNSPSIFATPEDSPYRFENKTTSSTYSLIVNRHIDNQSKRFVKRGDLVAYVGNESDNGGWTPHIHITLQIPQISSQFQRLDDFKDLKTKTDDQLAALVRGVHARGVVMLPANSSPYRTSHTVDYMNASGYADPNNIFDFYDDQTPIARYKN